MKRLFVLSFEGNMVKTIKDYNVITDGRNFDQTITDNIKQKKTLEILLLGTVDYTTDNLLDYLCFKENY